MYVQINSPRHYVMDRLNSQNQFTLFRYCSAMPCRVSIKLKFYFVYTLEHFNIRTLYMPGHKKNTQRHKVGENVCNAGLY